MELSRLDEPFAPQDIEWRVQQSGKSTQGKVYAMVLAYVTNRAIMSRLDDVCGKGCWRNEYCPAPAGGVMCGISIKIDGEWITKWDAAENTEVEAVKGGMSGAMKRAAVQWGIGRYLYNLDSGFATVSTERVNGWTQAKLKDQTKFWWQPPTLPAWALPPIQQPQQQNKPSSTDKQPDPRTPQQLLNDFTEYAIKASAANLNKAWKAADKSLNGTEQHAKAQSIYLDRKAELEQAA